MAVFVPLDQSGVPAGKVRTLLYLLCGKCWKRTDCLHAVEQALTGASA
jgi:hypothetical protein